MSRQVRRIAGNKTMGNLFGLNLRHYKIDYGFGVQAVEKAIKVFEDCVVKTQVMTGDWALGGTGESSAIIKNSVVFTEIRAHMDLEKLSENEIQIRCALLGFGENIENIFKKGNEFVIFANVIGGGQVLESEGIHPLIRAKSLYFREA